MTKPYKPDNTTTVAAILLWQSRFRLLLITAIGAITLALHWAGAIDLQSVVAVRYGAYRALVWFAALTITYFAFISTIALWVRRRGNVDKWGLAATLAADVIAFTGAVFLGAPPEWYERALILCMFPLMLALLYSGWRAAMLTLLFVIAAYLGMLMTAERFGAEVQMNESLWTLGVFTLGVSAFVMLHADLAARLSMIVRMLGRAREGVFALSFDENKVVETDGITVIGDAYEKMREEITSLIMTDPLTLCFNPRGFEQQCAREIARAARHDAGVVMLAIDLDHFKLVNDTHGHLAGDDVLRAIGEVLRKTARISDVVARVGGEEFVIFAAEAEAMGAKLFAQRLLDACRKHTFSVMGDKPVTISIGIAVDKAKTPEVLKVLRARADEALYSAKNSGRNRAVLWKEGVQSPETRD